MTFLSTARVLASGSCALALAACLVNEPDPYDPPLTSTPGRDTQWYYESDVRRVDTSVLKWSDGRVERHGLELRRDPDGTLRSEETFEHDLPVGVSRTWYASGALRSEVDYGDRVSLAPMTFWFENGQKAGEGLGIAGVKEGEWTIWHPGGQVAEKGRFERARKVGWWKQWEADGTSKRDVWFGEPDAPAADDRL